MSGLNSTDEDYINTQILDVDNTGLKITQDIVVSVAVSYIAEEAVKNTIYQLGGKQLLDSSTRRYNAKVTSEMLDRIAKMANQKLTGSYTKRLTQMFSRRAARVVLKSLGKSAASAAARAGTVTAGGCTLGPVGCAAGAAIGSAIFAAELAFTVFATIQDIQDKRGILNIFHKEYIDFVTKDFKDTLDKTYEELGAPGYMEEEALFYPELFIIDFDKDGTPYLDKDNKWARKFIEYQDEYLRSVGVEDGWEERLQAETISPPVLKNNFPKKILNVATGITIVGIIAIVLIIIFVIIISFLL